MNLIQRFNIFCAPPGGTHIYSLSIYMGPPRWGTQHFNFFSTVIAILGHSLHIPYMLAGEDKHIQINFFCLYKNTDCVYFNRKQKKTV